MGRGFSFVLALAAAGSVLEFGSAVHSSVGLCFFIPGKVFAFAFVFALRQAAICSLLDASALIPMAQMKPSKLASHRGDDLSLVFSCRRQPSVAFVQSVLCFPGNLLDLFRHPLLSLAQRRSD